MIFSSPPPQFGQCCQLGLRGQQHAQRDRQRQHPLPHRHMWDDVVDQAPRGLRHPARTARGTEPSPFAAEGQQLVVAALAAAQPREAVSLVAAFEEGVELGGDICVNADKATSYGLELLMEYWIADTPFTPYVSGTWMRRQTTVDDFATYKTDVPPLLRPGRPALRGHARQRGDLG